MRKKLLILALVLTGAVMASQAPREASALLTGCGSCPEGECCQRCHFNQYLVCVCSGPYICN